MVSPSSSRIETSRRPGPVALGSRRARGSSSSDSPVVVGASAVSPFVHERELDLDLRVVGDTQADLLRELELEVAPLDVELAGHLERVAVPARLEGKRTFREIRAASRRSPPRS